LASSIVLLCIAKP